MAVSSRGLLARYHVGSHPGPGQPAGVSHATVAQVSTDLQGIGHAERNWSDEGWRLAVAAGVPGLVSAAGLPSHARLGTVRARARPPKATAPRPSACSSQTADQPKRHAVS